MSETYHYLEELFDSFERVEKISEVLILGVDGGVRRCVLDQDKAYSTGDEIK